MPNKNSQEGDVSYIRVVDRKEIAQDIQRKARNNRDDKEEEVVWFCYWSNFGFNSYDKQKVSRLSKRQRDDLHLDAFDKAVQKGIELGMKEDKAVAIATQVSTQDRNSVWAGYRVPNAAAIYRSVDNRRTGFIPPKKR